MRYRIHAAALLAAGFLLPAAASASDGGIAVAGTPQAYASLEPLAAVESAGAEPVPAAAQAAVPDAPASAAGFGTVVAADRLDAMRGGDGNTDTTINRADLRGNVDGNTATNVVSGDNRVADGAFGNAAGISTVIQNSGSNVLIQNSTIVNVRFVDPTP
ncbi:hypothetical protein [Lysobacter sp. N42]|uniref:hypothetical protein n=1 Tax=Lysobacter sp. N42 TaxID=2545719 RepID=UPI00104E3D29|nr:hypothetical protein [Lysobacter sp. N42]TCZ82017.1 hypothetical protein EYQ95_23585 [Lysobacter sp. N42]